MPDLPNDQPFIAFRFDLRFDAVSLGGFSECTGLSLDFPSMDYAEGGRNGATLKFPTRANQSNVTLKTWCRQSPLMGLVCQRTARQARIRRTASIVVLDAAGQKPTMIFELTRAFPIKWSGPDLNALQNNLAVESLELCHEGLNWVSN